MLPPLLNEMLVTVKPLYYGPQGDRDKCPHYRGVSFREVGFTWISVSQGPSELSVIKRCPYLRRGSTVFLSGWFPLHLHQVSKAPSYFYCRVRHKKTNLPHNFPSLLDKLDALEQEILLKFHIPKPCKLHV